MKRRTLIFKNMKKTLLVCCALALTVCAQAQWKPAGDKIKTK